MPSPAFEIGKILGKLTTKQFLDAVENELRHGKTYLAIAKGLLAAEPTVFMKAPTFFGLMTEAGVILAQLTIARLFDKARNTVKLSALLVQAKGDVNLFQRGDKKAVGRAISAAMREVNTLKPVLNSIRIRRNEWLAHLSQDTVRDPKALESRAKLTIPDLDLVFEKTEKIVRELQGLLDGTMGPISFLGGNDYEALIGLIRGLVAAERQKFDAAFESQFGHPPPKV